VVRGIQRTVKWITRVAKMLSSLRMSLVRTLDPMTQVWKVLVLEKLQNLQLEDQCLIIKQRVACLYRKPQCNNNLPGPWVLRWMVMEMKTRL